ncbi:MAG: hypothetical protein AB4290_07890 [Spirulina sp.]
MNNYPLPITHYPLPITHYPLPLIHHVEFFSNTSKKFSLVDSSVYDCGDSFWDRHRSGIPQSRDRSPYLSHGLSHDD